MTLGLASRHLIYQHKLLELVLVAVQDTALVPEGEVTRGSLIFTPHEKEVHTVAVC